MAKKIFTKNDIQIEIRSKYLRKTQNVQICIYFEKDLIYLNKYVIFKWIFSPALVIPIKIEVRTTKPFCNKERQVDVQWKWKQLSWTIYALKALAKHKISSKTRILNEHERLGAYTIYMIYIVFSLFNDSSQNRLFSQAWKRRRKWKIR